MFGFVSIRSVHAARTCCRQIRPAARGLQPATMLHALKSGISCLMLVLAWGGVFAQYEDCPETPHRIWDGSCDEENSDDACGVDGGDCCGCTRVRHLDPVCDWNGFSCLDPALASVSDDCPSMSFDLDQCPPDMETNWVVDDTESARVLAEAVGCSGGTFEAIWRGHVVLNQTIFVSSGTVLSVTGVDSAAAIDGRGSFRLFAIVNATLSVSNVAMENGFASFGGAVALIGSNLYLNETHLTGNIAEHEGGAIYMANGSSCSWAGSVSFTGNGAGSHGGVVYVGEGSSVSWSGDTIFSGNFASSRGGALFITGNSSLSWSSRTEFLGNKADSGGAVCALATSQVAWEAETCFSDNFANSTGGAMLVASSSTAKWTMNTSFVGNGANDDGGAIYVQHDGYQEQDASSLVVAAPTMFYGNTCGRRGGAIAAILAASLTFESRDVRFEANSAGTAGGALFLAGLFVGPRIFGARFVGNSASIGGGVSVTNSGIAIGTNEVGSPKRSPTTFIHCSFVGNVAVTSGGALDSWIGSNLIMNGHFEGNSASRGGALNLAGTSWLHNCSFIENTSAEDGGPAVQSLGGSIRVSEVTFVGNEFWCDSGRYRDDSVAEEKLVYDAICKGCDLPCDKCELPGNVPICSPAPDHTSSDGGDATVETLLLSDGYWRPSPTSMDIRECFNEAACLGGLTGDPGFCVANYEGPFCSICSRGYRRLLGFECVRCNKHGVALAVLLGVLAAAVLVYALDYMLSVKATSESTNANGVSRADFWRRRLQTLKIMVVTFQLLSQVASEMKAIYPGGYQGMLNAIDTFNFDIGWIVDIECFSDVDFHVYLVMATVTPLVVLTILGLAYAVGRFLHRKSMESLETIRRKFLSLVIVVTFVAYTPVSSILFQAFACDGLENGDLRLLRADYRIECDSARHREIQVYAGFMMAIYPIGIPALYGLLLFGNPASLTDKRDGNDEALPHSSSGLRELYKPNRYYYELVECGRRLFFSGAMVLVFPGRAAQMGIGLVVGTMFLVMAEVLDPYHWVFHAYVARMGQLLLWVSMILFLIMEIDVVGEEAGSSELYAWLLLVFVLSMISIVAGEAIVSLGRQGRGFPIEFGGRGRCREYILAVRLGLGDPRVHHAHDSESNDDEDICNESDLSQSRISTSQPMI